MPHGEPAISCLGKTAVGDEDVDCLVDVARVPRRDARELANISAMFSTCSGFFRIADSSMSARTALTLSAVERPPRAWLRCVMSALPGRVVAEPRRHGRGFAIEREEFPRLAAECGGQAGGRPPARFALMALEPH